MGSSCGGPSPAGPALQAAASNLPSPTCDPALGPSAVPGASRPPASCQAGPADVFIADKGRLFGGAVVCLVLPVPGVRAVTSTVTSTVRPCGGAF